MIPDFDGNYVRNTFALRLRERREHKGWSQGDLAKRTGLMPSAISHFECGRRTPNLENLCLLCTELRTSADYLMGLILHDRKE